MKAHTTAFKDNIKEFGREIDSVITYTIDGTTTELGGEQLNAVSPSFEGNILKSVMRQLEIDSNLDIPINTVVNFKFGVKTRYDDVVDYSDNYDYVDFGNYVVYKSEKQEDLSSYKITCYDKMLFSMIPYEALSITYPITIRDYISAICTKLGLTFKNSSDTFVNYDKEIPNELYLDSDGNSLDYTFRDVLDELAQVTASTICINENDDELEIRYIQENGGVTLLKNIPTGTDISNTIFTVDTTDYTSTELVDGITGVNNIAVMGRDDDSVIILVGEGNTIPMYEEQLDINATYPDGTSFTPDNSHVYVFYIRIQNGGQNQLIVLNDLSSNTKYGDFDTPENYILDSLSLNHYPDSVIWNCFKIIQSEDINEEYLKDINVNFGEKYGPINSIVLSRSADSDNIYEKDDESIAEYGLCELKIKDNQIMNFNDRDEYLQEIFAQLNGLEYYINDFSSTGICYYNLCDSYNISIDNNVYNCIMMNDEINITQGLEEIIHTDMLEESETDYTKADKTDRKLSQTYIIADKANKKVESVVVDLDNLGDTVTELGTRYTQTTSEFQYQITQLNDKVNETSEDFEERIDTLETTDPERLKNTLVEINVNGIQVATNTSKISSLMANNKFAIQDNFGTELTFIGYDEDLGRSVSRMDNLAVTNYLNAGYHRQQKFEINGENRTGWFYLGGD